MAEQMDSSNQMARHNLLLVLVLLPMLLNLAIYVIIRVNNNSK